MEFDAHPTAGLLGKGSASTLEFGGIYVWGDPAHRFQLRMRRLAPAPDMGGSGQGTGIMQQPVGPSRKHA